MSFKLTQFFSVNQLKVFTLTLFFTVKGWAEGTDILDQAFKGSAASTLGSKGMLWNLFILVDIILATALAVKSKNPMVFVGVAAIAFIPRALLTVFGF